MNRKLLLIFLVNSAFLISLSSYSQAKIGIRGGLNLNDIASNYTDGEESNTKMKLGGQLGLVAQLELSDELGFQTGLIFNSKGFSSDEVEGDDYDRFSLNYLEIPLNMTFNFSDQVMGIFGPYIGIGVGGKNKYEFNGNADELKMVPKFGTVKFEDVEEDEFPYNGLDYGLSLGIGFMPDDNSIISFGYSFGLTNINNDLSFDAGGSTTTISAKDFKDVNRVLSITFTHFFN